MWPSSAVAPPAWNWAASLVQLVDNLGGYGAEHLRQHTRIRLLEAGPRILPEFPESVSDRVRRQLQDLGVQVRTDAMVQKATEQGFELKDDCARSRPH